MSLFRRSSTAWLVSVIASALVVAACGAGDGRSETPLSGPDDASPPDTATETASPRALTGLDLPVHVAVTLPIFEDFVRLAGGDHVEVFSVVPDNTDPDTYELTAEDIERLDGVEFFYVNGLGLDDHLRESFEQHRDEDAHVIPFAPNVRSPTAAGRYAEEAGDEAHLWLDPELASIYVAIIADEFVIYDEVNRSFYDDNLRNADDTLRRLGVDLAAELEAIPDQRRKIVASSAAVTHFSRRFDLAVAGLASGAEPGESPSDAVQRLASVVESEGVPAVFGEFGHDNSIVEQVAMQTGVDLCMLYTDVAPGLPLSYEDLMRANTAELLRCLAAE